MKTKLYILFLLTAFLFTSCNRINHLYIQFGEAKSKYQLENDSVLRVYFDRHGNIYPDTAIDDSTLRKNASILDLYYKNDPNKFVSLCIKEGIKHPDISRYSETLSQFQSKLVQKYVSRINSMAYGKEVVFIIHGFNDHPTKGEVNSFAENKATRNLIAHKFDNKHFLFVEVYWDGMSKENGNKCLLVESANSFKIWNNSQVSATYAGLELRRIISHVKKDSLYAVTHSHGAGVITNALFNVVKFDSNYYLKGGKFIKAAFCDSLYNTPKQQIFVGMLAPAIPGQTVFDDYFKRTSSGKEVNELSANNLHFIIGFNYYDSITRKFYTKSSWFGTTTLACRYGELVKTITIMNNDPTLLDFVDFSITRDKRKQRDHSWIKYLENDPHSSIFFNKVFTHIK